MLGNLLKVLSNFFSTGVGAVISGAVAGALTGAVTNLIIKKIEAARKIDINPIFENIVGLPAEALSLPYNKFFPLYQRLGERGSYHYDRLLFCVVGFTITSLKRIPFRISRVVLNMHGVRAKKKKYFMPVERNVFLSRFFKGDSGENYVLVKEMIDFHFYYRGENSLSSFIERFVNPGYVDRFIDIQDDIFAPFWVAPTPEKDEFKALLEIYTSLRKKPFKKVLRIRKALPGWWR
jgi:hypothetical protein